MGEPTSMGYVYYLLKITDFVLKKIPFKNKELEYLSCRTRPFEVESQLTSVLARASMKKFSSLSGLSDEEIQNIDSQIDYVFSNLTFSQKDISNENTLIKRDKKLIKWFNFSRDFHRNPDYYEDARNFLEVQHDNTNRFKKDIEKEYISDILSDELLSRTTKNRLFLIKGDIGSGKSSLLTKTYIKITDILKNNPRVIHKVVMIDFQNFLAKDLYPEKNIDLAFERLLSRLKQEIKKQVKIKPKSSLPIVIMLDNLDELYDHYCKLSFFDNFNSGNSHESLRKYYPLLYKYLQHFHFYNNNIFNGPIINVMCCRDDTSDLLNMDRQYKDRSCEIDIDTILKLQDGESICKNNGDGLYTKHILIKRMKMLSKYLENTNDSICSKIIDENIKLLKNSDTSFYDIDKISVHGLRHTMSLFKVAAFALLDVEMFKRVFLNNNILRKLHFMGKATRYSQTNEGLVNIFLINRGYRLQYLKPDRESPEYEHNIYEKIKNANHIHTYWLKYLILFAISKGVKSKQDILNLFTADFKEDKGYNKTIVELLLLSLSQVEHGRLIRPHVSQFDENGEPDDVSIILTNRAKYLLENNTFFSFGYLANILEDKWLTFIYPDKRIEGYAEHIEILESVCNFSNSYIFDGDNTIYKEKAIEALNIKIPLVSLFIDILTHSLEAEKSLRNDVFLTLNTILKKKKIFDLSAIEKSISNDIINIEKNLKIDKNYLLNIWDRNRNPRADRVEDKKIIQAKNSVKKVYKIHSANPTRDVK